MNNKVLLTTALMATTLGAVAQGNKHAYAITGDGNNDFIWMNIRQVDLQSGKVTKTVFERSNTHFLLTDINSKKTVDQSATANGNIFASTDYPTSTYVAAAAFDKTSNKLFFTPMRMGELRWMDMNVRNETPQFYTMKSELLAPGLNNDEAVHITRMVIGADGFGYAVSNDANRFINFTNVKKPV